MYGRVQSQDQTTPNPGDSPYYDNFVYNYPDSYIAYNLTGVSSPVESYDGGERFDGKNSFWSGIFCTSKRWILAELVQTFFLTTACEQKMMELFLIIHSFIELHNPSTTETVDKELLWLSIVDQDLSSETALIGYVDGATNEKEPII